MVLAKPNNHGEQNGGDKQHDVAPMASVGEVSGLALKRPTLLLSQEQVVDVLSDHLLERDSTGYLVFRNQLQQFQFRSDDGSQVGHIRSGFARHAAEQYSTG